MELTKEELVELIHKEARATGAPAPLSPDEVAIVRDATLKAMEPLLEKQGADITKKLTDAMDERAPKAPVIPIGRKIRAMGLATIEDRSKAGDYDFIKHQVKRYWSDEIAGPTVKWLDAVAQTKTTHTVGNASIAGDIVQPAYSPQWIEMLRAKTTVRGIGYTEPMPRGALSVRRQSGDVSSTYQGENDKMTVSNITVDRANLSYKKLTTLAVISNDLLRFAGGEADSRVEASMLASAALREDRAFLLGNPPIDAGSPKGIYYWTNATNRYACAGVTLANFQADLTKAFRLVEEQDIDVTPENSYIIMSPATFWALFALATTTGDMLFAAGLSGAQPRLFGYRVLKTSQLRVDRAWIQAISATVGGCIMFVHGPSCGIYDSYQSAIAVYPGGAYYDATAATVLSGISQDETVVTLISEHDFLLKYDKAAAIITGYAT